jgi:UDP-glucuronate decarboxylase
MLGLAKRLGIRILQASTSEVYGDPEISPQNESYWGNVNPIGVRSCYDEGKRAAESLFFDYNRQFGVQIRVARIFNTYGPRMNLHDGRVVSNFVFQALTNQDITLYGNGEQTRSFCYVSDLIDGLVKLMESEGSVIGPINLGNPNEFTMKDLAKKVIEMTSSASKMTYHELPLDDPKQRRPDTTLAESKLNWKAQVELDEGLALLVRDFKSRIM